ncbi:LysR family transcriptional regulator [Dactylosporangium sp. McL0621]|uniref:LysR family transcriptional regulator n=1 Tax=Dactylosporangium sp. McL0621 TaxID=3415678 RepID=UPI003CED7F52
MDLDLRKLRYFVAVAEHLHFGRAARALHVAQPMLSRQIRVFEQELHAELFVRDRHGVALTPAGAELLEAGRPLLAGAAAARRRVATAARGAGAFTVAFMPGLVVTGAVRALEEAHPGLVVGVVRTYWDEQSEVLRDGRADVSYVRLPVATDGLRLEPLAAEPRVVVLPAGHPLAGRVEPAAAHAEQVAAHAEQVAAHAEQVAAHDEPAAAHGAQAAAHGAQAAAHGEQARGEQAAARGERARGEQVAAVRLAELAGETLLQPVDAVPEWRWATAKGAPARSVEEKLELVARERGVVVLPRSVSAFYRRPDVAVVPVADLPPGEVALAWVAGRRSPLIREFVNAAREHPPC